MTNYEKVIWIKTLYYNMKIFGIDYFSVHFDILLNLA